MALVKVYSDQTVRLLVEPGKNKHNGTGDETRGVVIQEKEQRNISGEERRKGLQ